MSAPTEVPASNATESKPTEDNAAKPDNPTPKIEVPATTNTDNANQNNSKPIKKVKSKKGWHTCLSNIDISCLVCKS